MSKQAGTLNGFSAKRSSQATCSEEIGEPTAREREITVRFRKPSLPPLLACTLGTWVMCAVLYSCGCNFSIQQCLYVVAFAALGTFVLLWWCWRGRAALLRCVILGMALGAFLGGIGACLLHVQQENAGSSSAQMWYFELLEDASRSTYGTRARARATAQESGESYTVNLTLPEEYEQALYGEKFSGFVRLAAISESSRSYNWQRGIAANAKPSSLEPISRSGLFSFLVTIRASAIEILLSPGGQGSALAAALVCGYRESIDELGLYADFKACGLAHLVAVSGSHLIIVCGLVGVLLRTFRLPRAACLILQGCFMLAYLVVAAAPISAVRAALMATAGMSSYFFKRRSASMNAVGICVLGMLVVSPAASVSVSFLLSAASTLGIVMLSPLLSAWTYRFFPHMPSVISDALSLTVAASLITAPYSAALFSQLPLISVFANIVAAPLFSLACGVGLFATIAALVCTPLVTVAALAAAFSSNALALLASFLASLPFSCIPVSLPELPMLALSGVLVFALWRAWPLPSLRTLVALPCAAGLVLVCLCVVLPSLAPDEIVMLDVGQGDAFIIRSKGKSVLIDTGTNDGELLEGLARHGIYHLDALILTHSDDDHVGSLPALRSIVNVERVCVANGALTCTCASCSALVANAHALVGQENTIGLSSGDTLRCGSFSLKVIWPKTYQDEGGNADSLCILASVDINADNLQDYTALFVGDAEYNQLEDMTNDGLVGQVDIYKVGHHGSKAALSDELISILSPAVALISVGENNRYGHPSQETLERLASVDARVFRSDTNGDVSCRFTTERIVVSTLR